MLRCFHRVPLLAFPLLLARVGAPLAAQDYHVGHTYTLGGDGGWDYLALDTVGHRMFIARQNRVMVVNPDNGTLLGEVPGLNRAHGVAFDYAGGHGFATSGGDSTVYMFDLKSLAVVGTIHAAEDDDAILYDPATRRIYTMNGDAESATAIDPATARNVGTIPLGGKPEFGVSDGTGRLFINLEDKAEIAEVDPATLSVTRHWSIGPCESPTGLAIDVAHRRLFSGCRNGLMAISDAEAGRLLTTTPIGRGVDACRFDPGTQLAFASNGEGTITVIHEDAPDQFTVVANVPTRQGARTMELDLVTHRLYTATADFGPAPAPTADHPRPRPPLIPGTFAVLEVEDR